MDQKVEAELARADLELREDADGLILEGDGMRLRASFDDMKRRLLRGKLNGELLVRAARVKGVAVPTLVDATAGLGQDRDAARMQSGHRRDARRCCRAGAA